jgi:hypothetical protein
MDSRVPRPWHDAFHRSLHPPKPVRLLRRLSLSLGKLQNQGENPSSVARCVGLTELDGKLLPGPANIPLAGGVAVHQVHIVLG